MYFIYRNAQKQICIISRIFIEYLLLEFLLEYLSLLIIITLNIGLNNHIKY